MKKTSFRTLVIGVKTITIEGRDLLNSKYSKESWRLIARSRVRDCWKITKRVKEFLVNLLNRTPAEGATGYPDTKGSRFSIK